MGSPQISHVIERMEAALELMRPEDALRHFHLVYLRTTKAVAEELDRGGFQDPEWLHRWDVAFASLYLDALDAWHRDSAPGAWQIPFEAARDQPHLQPIRHVLFGMNVHINFDLPQALLEVITDDEFESQEVRELRRDDHSRMDEVLARRVRAEDRELPGKTLADRALAPLNRRATRQFLQEAREKVWRNAMALSRARRRGAASLAEEIQVLDHLCAERVADLVRPGLVVLRLARNGFGVLLPSAGER